MIAHVDAAVKDTDHFKKIHEQWKTMKVGPPKIVYAPKKQSSEPQ